MVSQHMDQNVHRAFNTQTAIGAYTANITRVTTVTMLKTTDAVFNVPAEHVHRNESVGLTADTLHVCSTNVTFSRTGFPVHDELLYSVPTATE